ncbi:hypothetical protein F511_38574 [Dorcoceras hygrometricum]|uniref:Uncharacterized protein n=1 Tax=Dorcoceras hygrometricum TaxID=472368 RepID=A0A2Z7C080_9LAMI|nr:hypothetical protein F511_38574 [Dorcoceras hygrometricum]
MAEVIGCTTSRAVWLALEAAFSHCSKSGELSLKDDLKLMKKGNRTVFEYSINSNLYSTNLRLLVVRSMKLIKPFDFFVGLAHLSQVLRCSASTHPTPDFSGSPL